MVLDKFLMIDFWGKHVGVHKSLLDINKFDLGEQELSTSVACCHDSIDNFIAVKIETSCDDSSHH